MTKSSYADWLHRYRFAALLLILVAAACAIAGATRLTVEGDYKIFFKKDSPEMVATEALEEAFSKNETLLIVVAPRRGEIFTPEMIGLVKEITDEAWQVPYSSRVDSFTNFQYTQVSDDDLIVEDLIPDLAVLDQDMIERARRVSRDEPALFKKLVSERQHAAAINVRVELPSNHAAGTEYKEIVSDVRQRLTKYQQRFPDVDFYLSGVVEINHSFSHHSDKDMTFLMPLMLAVVALTLLLFFRSLLIAFCISTVMLLSVAITMGLSGWIGFPISPQTSVVPIIVMTLAVASAVHVVSSMQYALAAGGDRVQAVAQSLQLNIKPIFIASLTTLLGMLTLNFSEAPPFHDLGNMVAMGVIVSFILSMAMLPIMLALLPISAPKRITANASDSATMMTEFGGFVIKHYRTVFWLSIALLAIAVSLLPLNEVNDDAQGYFKPHTVYRQASSYINENMAGSEVIDMALFTDQQGGVHNPEFLMLLEDFVQWLRNYPNVDHVLSLSDTFKRLNQNMHQDDPAWYRQPESNELAAQYLLLYEFSLPYGLDLNNQLDFDKSATRIIISVADDIGSSKMVQLESDIHDWVKQRNPDIRVGTGGASLMFARIGERNIPSMLMGVVVAMLCISAVLIVALRSIKMGIVSLVPNLVPAFVGFGLWGVISGEINIAVSCVAAITLGIVVDDTVHFLTKYQSAKEQGRPVDEALLYAFSSVGRALFITTVVLAMGFIVLAFSDFMPNASLGTLTAIIIVAALALDLLFLPSLILMINRFKPNAAGTL